MNIVSATALTVLQEDCLELLIQAFLETKKAENVASRTLTFYNQKLHNFNNYCLTQQIKTVSQISPYTMREYLLFLRERDRNDGGI